MIHKLLESWGPWERWIPQEPTAAPDAVVITVAALLIVIFLFLLRRVQIRLVQLWDHLSASFWFLPGLMMTGAVALSLAMVEVDALVQARTAERIEWLWDGGPEAARVLLGTIAGSLITIAGVVFSITMVVLALVSGQFGPRLMRNFREDKGNQLVLGTFIATFVYCLLVLRKVTNGPGADFVPYLSIALSIVLVLVNMAVIIYFIHHIAVMTQAPYIISLVSDDLGRSINSMFPEELGEDTPSDEPETDFNLSEFDRRARQIDADRNGYLQAIDSGNLMALAKSHDLVIHVHYIPGDFIHERSPLVSIQGEKQVDEGLCEQIRKVFAVGKERTPRQDVEYGVRQLVEIAVRALSPGINDPFTAMTCVDHLGTALCRAARRRIPSRYRHDAQKQLRIIVEPVTFDRLIEAAFNQIRHYGQSSAAVSNRLLETLAVIARCLARKSDITPLQLQAQTIRDASRAYPPLDQRGILLRYETFMEALEAKVNCGGAMRWT